MRRYLLCIALLAGGLTGCSEEQAQTTDEPPTLTRPLPNATKSPIQSDLLHFSRDNSEPRLEVVKPETLSAAYANEFEIHSGSIELILNLGVLSKDRESNGSRFEIAHRIALSYYTAKRLLSALEMALKRHEQAFVKLEPKEPAKPTTIESPPNVAYANFCRVMSTPEELILDCGLNPQPYATGRQKVNVSHTIVMLHSTAKRLFVALNDVIQKYEKEHGALELDVRKRVIPGIR